MPPPKAILEFDLSDHHEKQEHRRAVNNLDAYLSLWDIAQEIFRPHRKHGYPNSELQKLLDSNEAVGEAIGILETQFYEILKHYGVNLDEDIS